jgi:hypothetical protein
MPSAAPPPIGRDGVCTDGHRKSKWRWRLAPHPKTRFTSASPRPPPKESKWRWRLARHPKTRFTSASPRPPFENPSEKSQNTEKRTFPHSSPYAPVKNWPVGTMLLSGMSCTCSEDGVAHRSSNLHLHSPSPAKVGRGGYGLHGELLLHNLRWPTKLFAWTMWGLKQSWLNLSGRAEAGEAIALCLHALPPRSGSFRADRSATMKWSANGGRRQRHPPAPPRRRATALAPAAKTCHARQRSERMEADAAAVEERKAAEAAAVANTCPKRVWAAWIRGGAAQAIF